jgi:hypothetical protein
MLPQSITMNEKSFPGAELALPAVRALKFDERFIRMWEQSACAV